MAMTFSTVVKTIAILAMVIFCQVFSAKEDDQKLLTCKNCPGNRPRCRTTCQGYYCYKMELNITGEITVKSGCLNNTDSKTLVGECTLSHGKVPGSSYTERFCICSRDLCNTGIIGIRMALLLVLFPVVLFLL